eukprot:2485055-Pleurochrysis_carterae.AAC.1
MDKLKGRRLAKAGRRLRPPICEFKMNFEQNQEPLQRTSKGATTHRRVARASQLVTCAVVIG